jgi:tryptophanyl-tRNA synthetase
MRVLSGIQPTGNLTLGNYLGAIVQWVEMQNANPGACLFFMADLHAITVHNDPAVLRDTVRELAAALIASGIDPAKSILFNQTRVPEHSELAWLLMCTARMGWLNRMTQFKEKSGKDREGASIGLFAYPVLQAADVLLYQATHVPVGDDQKQHLELARDIAEKFNNDTGSETFTLPEPMIGKTAARIMSLRDGTAKMSKSDPSDMSRINMVDDDALILQKFKKAKTDPDGLPSEVAGLEGRPEARNLVAIYAALARTDMASVLRDFGGQGFGAFKPALAELTISALNPIREKFLALKEDSAAIDAILADGSERARNIAAPTLAKAQAALGLFAR